jgi:hypothetical protein
MSKLLVVVISCLLGACARHGGWLSRAEFCDPDPPQAVPSSWHSATIPGSSAALWLPPGYVGDGRVWRGPRGSLVTVTWRPHLAIPFPAPGTITAGGVECGHRLGWRLVFLERWAEWPTEAEGRVRYVTKASWQEQADSDLVVTASAIDKDTQLEHLRIIHSLQRRAQ